MDFPFARLAPPPILTTYSREACGAALRIGGGNGNGLNGAATGSWPTANKALFFPFILTDWAVVYQLLFYVGATSAGNVDMGIYTPEGTRVVSAGSTAMSASVNTIQELNVTDTTLAPGRYLLAAACSSTSGTCFRLSPADETILCSYPTYEQASAFALPATATPVLSTDTTPRLVVWGAQLRSVY